MFNVLMPQPMSFSTIYTPLRLDHWTSYHHLKGVDGAKNALIEDILSRYDALMLQCQSLINEQNAQTALTPEATSNTGMVVLVSAVTTSDNRYTSR
jgi:hypothetical protein